MYRKGDTSDLARFYTGHHPIQFLAKLDENQKKKKLNGLIIFSFSPLRICKVLESQSL